MDENISPVIVAALEASGHDVVSAVKIMPAASDEAVLERARILITEDKDFGELAYKHGRHAAGIIRVALPDYLPAQKAVRLRDVIAAIADGIAGHAVVVQPTRIRSRALPGSP